MSVVLTAEELRRVMGRVSRSHAEKDFQASIVTAARFMGWQCFHVHDSRRSVPGFPDLELARHTPRPRLIKAEIKDVKGRLSLAQMDYLDLYAKMGTIEVYVFRPHLMDRIIDLLHPGWTMPSDANPADYGVWQCRTNV